MAGTHSRLSASGAPAYFRCRGKPNAEEGLPDDESEFAAEGTLLHDIAAMCLEWDLNPRSFADKKFEQSQWTFTVDRHTTDQMQKGIDFISERAEDAKLVVETRLDLSEVLGPGEAGTMDAGIIDTKRGRLTGFDWKWGAGVEVEVEHNEQVLLYLAGLWLKFADEFWEWTANGVDDQIEIVLVIFQPRISSEPQEWSISLADLIQFMAEAKQVAIETKDPSAPRVAGEKQCKFCKRAAAPDGCYALTESMLDLLDADDEQIDDGQRHEYPMTFPHPYDLSPERRAYIHENRSLIEKWLGHVSAAAKVDVQKGLKTGLKIVIGKCGPRQYVAESEEAVMEVLAAELSDDQMYDRKLISPTTAEKRLSNAGYTKLSAFVTQSPGRETLVHSSNKKKAVKTDLELLDED